MSTKEKYEFHIGHVRVETLGFTPGAQIGSRYKVFEIEHYGDSSERVCDLLAKTRDPVSVKLKVSEDAPLEEIGTAVEVWCTGNWFVKVLVDKW